MAKNKPNITISNLLNSGYRYGLSLTSSKQDAEDLVHDAWLRLVKRYDRAPELPLLYRTIRNLYIDKLRKEQTVSRHRESEYFEYCSVESELEKEFVSSEEIRFCLSKLKDTENEVIYLSVVEGYTASEIASFTGASRGTVLSLLYRSKQKLKAWLMDTEYPAAKTVNSKINTPNVVDFVAKRTR